MVLLPTSIPTITVLGTLSARPLMWYGTRTGQMSGPPTSAGVTLPGKMLMYVKEAKIINRR